MNINSQGKQPIPLRGNSEPNSTIIAVGGGKGGVGKSLISTSVALLLAKQGYETVLVDLDLDGSNVHTYFGEYPDNGLENYLKKPHLGIDYFLKRTHNEKLRILTGASSSLSSSNISMEDRTTLMSALYNLKADYIVLDLSAGCHYSTLDFFLMAKRQILALTPDPTSIENNYRFIKASFFRKVLRFKTQLGLADVGPEIDLKNWERFTSPMQFLKTLSTQSQCDVSKIKRLMENTSFNIVLNQIHSPKEQDIGQSIESVCKKFFGVEAKFIGALEHNSAVWQSLRKKKHVLVEYPQSPIYTQLFQLMRELTREERSRVAV